MAKKLNFMFWPNGTFVNLEVVVTVDFDKENFNHKEPEKWFAKIIFINGQYQLVSKEYYEIFEEELRKLNGKN